MADAYGPAGAPTQGEALLLASSDDEQLVENPQFCIPTHFLIVPNMHILSFWGPP